MRRYFLIAIATFLILAFVGFLFFNQTATTTKAYDPVSQKKEKESNVPVRLNLPVPKKETVSYTTATEQSLTLFLLKEDKVFVYKGKDRNKGKIWDLSEIGNLLSKEKQTNGDSLMVIIKPSPFGTYHSTIDLLDKITESKIKYYTLSDVSKEEEEFIEKKQHEESK